MMISPNDYYYEYLRGKEADQIMSVIRGIKREIGHLKNLIEHPTYGEHPIVCPSEATRLHYTRLYLERAKEAYIEAGGIYIPSKAEMRACDFDENISRINKIIFKINTFPNESVRIYTLNEDNIYMDVENKHYTKLSNNVSDYSYSKEEFFEELRKLHIGEWRKYYNLKKYGCEVLDGTQWELEIHYSNDRKSLKIYGDNAYPYNFDQFKELLVIEEEEEIYS